MYLCFYIVFFIAQHACLFLIKSVLSKIKFIISYIFTGNKNTAKQMAAYLPKCIQVTSNLGLYIKMVVADQGPPNRALYSYLFIKGFDVDEYEFYHGNKCVGLNEIYKQNLSKILPSDLNKVQFSAKYGDSELPLIYDYCHLFKSIRNSLRNYDLKTPDGLVSFKIYEQIYNHDFNKPVKMCCKLTKAHIYPNNFQKMSVRLAVQLFSNSMAAAIQSLIPMKIFSDKQLAINTLNFTKKLNKLYDVLNGKFHLRLQSDEFKYLVEMMSYFQNIKAVNMNKNVRIYCFDGMVQTIKGILALSLEILSACKINTLCLKVFNQDDCENTFSKIRGRNGFKQNPSAFEIRTIIGRLISIDIIYNSPFSNCEETDSKNIPIDWNTVLETDVMELPSSEPECDTNSHSSQKLFRISDEMAIRYYAGYCIYKFIKSMDDNFCTDCKEVLIKQSPVFEHQSELLIRNKNYDNKSDFGSLFPPSNMFFEICNLQVT